MFECFLFTDLSSAPVKPVFFRPWEHGVPAARKASQSEEISVPAPLAVVNLPALMSCMSNPSAGSSSGLQVPSTRSPGPVSRPAGSPSPTDHRAPSPTDSAYSSSTSTCSPRSSPRLQPSTTCSSQVIQQPAFTAQQQHRTSPTLLPAGWYYSLLV